MRSGIGNSASDPFYVTQTTPSGASAPAGTTADPVSQKSVGSASIATAQNPSSVSPAAALQIVAARVGRQSVILTNITGTQPVYFGASGVTAATGLFLAGTAGASVTIPTAAAVFATSPTAAQTVSVLETF